MVTLHENGFTIKITMQNMHVSVEYLYETSVYVKRLRQNID